MRGKPQPGATGSEIYAVAGCISCHGTERMGGSSGPPLTDLSATWTESNLAAYFENPKKWIAKDARLQSLDKNYSSSMPSFEYLNLQERQRLAQWLLTQK